MWECIKRHKIVLVCIAISLYFFAASGYIQAKALLAQYLIAQAWTESQLTDGPVPPWSWADTHPVAKLTINKKSTYVLAGATGRTLAFGPAHMSSTPLPGKPGNSVITGHRDTHFSNLAELNVGDVIHIETLDDSTKYKVTHTRIVDEKNLSVIQNSAQDMVTLITCYPFNGLNTNTPLRWVVRAERTS